ncbi:MAG: class I SAM-dependent methyltransferase [Candidatus Thorarchaeota archaeon]|nr:class I SAM-dependent methyltransferase [Candidatus Thorarchaeota archaeon]
MSEYYSRKLSSNNLKRCYDIAPPRVQQYLESEMKYILDHISNSDTVLELGCGYGRVLKKLVPCSSQVAGVDISRESLNLAIEFTECHPRCHLIHSSAEKLPFPDNSIDKVVCIQNGISAFKIEPIDLIQESIRVTKEGGGCLFSSYSDKFWKHRLEWFQMQADAGLIGEIDWDFTSDGIISCKDGFKATTFRPDDFNNLSSQLGINSKVVEIDNSSIFFVISV